MLFSKCLNKVEDGLNNIFPLGYMSTNTKKMLFYYSGFLRYRLCKNCWDNFFAEKRKEIEVFLRKKLQGDFSLQKDFGQNRETNKANKIAKNTKKYLRIAATIENVTVKGFVNLSFCVLSLVCSIYETNYFCWKWYSQHMSFC